MLNLLIGPIAEIAGTWMSGQVEQTKAKAQTKVAKAQAEAGKTCFLIDGYPRNADNVNGWKECVGDDGANVVGVLFYEANEEELEKRLVTRGETSGRSDDTVEVIRKRFRTYVEETAPIVEIYREKGLVHAINGMPPVEEVWQVTEAKVKEFEVV